MIVGSSAALTACLQMLLDREDVFYLMAGSTAAGIGIMLYAQFKYNKGVF